MCLVVFLITHILPEQVATPNLDQILVEISRRRGIRADPLLPYTGIQRTTENRVDLTHDRGGHRLAHM